MINWIKKYEIGIYMLFGFLFCIVLTIGGDVVALLTGQEGGVWTPINSFRFRFGDNYYYGAWVAELLQHGIPLGSPSAVELIGHPLIESLRWFPLAVAAIPGFIFDDFRIVYMLDYVFTACLSFGIPFYFCYGLTRSKVGSLLVGVAVLFFSWQWLTLMPLAIGSPSWGNFWSWLGHVLYSPVNGSMTLFSMYEYEAIQGAFRYMHLSISGPLLMFYALLCHCIYVKKKPSSLVGVCLLIMSSFMAFSYPSHVIISYVMLGGYAVLAFRRGNRMAFFILSMVGVITALILLGGGYVPYVLNVFAENELWNNIFNKQSLTLIDRPTSEMILMALVNKYSLTMAIAFWFSRGNRTLRDMVLLFGLISCMLALTALFNMPLLWSRFMGRGIDQLWFMVFLIACIYGYKSILVPRFEQKVIRFFAVVVSLIVLALPIASFGVYDLRAGVNGSRFMPQEQWEALQWVKRNVDDGDVVAALDWNDISFLPIYTSAYLFVDHMIIGGRSPKVEIERYVTLWKLLGYPRGHLEARLKNTVAATRKYLSSGREQILHPPLAPLEEYASSQISYSVLYWPYVNEVEGHVIGEGNQTTADFVSWALSLYDRVDVSMSIQDNPFGFIMISGAERNIPLNPSVKIKKVFENSTHTIYKVDVP